MYKSNKKCKDDNLYIIGTYKNYKKHGEFLRYSIDSGMHYVLEIENYTIGVLDGLYIKWKSFKERDIEGEYISGKREGKWVLYKENLKYIIYYKNDIAQEWKCIDENGNIIKKGNGCPDFLKTFINP
ncbi:MAG: hypothetical protein HY738_11115 [Bacteroidia bacterium]|nr:hypothetical protein [Bacteroidia bacterium]